MSAPVVTINGAELRALTERMGLSVVWLSQEWGVSEGNIKRWMKGGDGHRIPGWIMEDVAHMVSDTVEQLAKMLEDAVQQSMAGAPPWLLVYRNDMELRDDLPEGHPARRYNAAWHRHLCMQVMEQVPGVRLRYALRPHKREE